MNLRYLANIETGMVIEIGAAPDDPLFKYFGKDPVHKKQIWYETSRKIYNRFVEGGQKPMCFTRLVKYNEIKGHDKVYIANKKEGTALILTNVIYGDDTGYNRADLRNWNNVTAKKKPKKTQVVAEEEYEIATFDVDDLINYPREFRNRILRDIRLIKKGIAPSRGKIGSVLYHDPIANTVKVINGIDVTIKTVRHKVE